MRFCEGKDANVFWGRGYGQITEKASLPTAVVRIPSE